MVLEMQKGRSKESLAEYFLSGRPFYAPLRLVLLIADGLPKDDALETKGLVTPVCYRQVSFARFAGTFSMYPFQLPFSNF